VIDRVGRPLIDLRYDPDLEACGATCNSTTAERRYDTPTGKLVFQITGTVAEFDRSIICQRIRTRLCCVLWRRLRLWWLPRQV
jgi:hypothetical protein